MNKFQYIFLSLLISISFCSCNDVFFGEEESSDPVNTFETFWNDFDEHYGLFVARGWNWDSIYQVYQPQVGLKTSDEELWTIFSEMIEYLDDEHTYILDPATDQYYSSGRALADQAEEEFSLQLMVDKFVDDLQLIPGMEENYYGKIRNKNLGYIYMESMDDGDPAMIDQVMEELEPFDALILDIRNNGGGEDPYAARIAAAFADDRHFIYTVQSRNGPNHDDFNEKRSYYTTPKANTYQKPVIVLTDRYTISAADIFMLHMKAFAHVTQIGDYTAGDFSDGSSLRFLPNGWAYQYSTQMFLLPDGSSLDGIGHEPDVFIKNTKADIQAGNDVVMERAFSYLLEEYGIE